MSLRRFLLLLGVLTSLLWITTTSARADMWVVAGTDPGYTAIGGTHSVTLQVSTPDDPQWGEEYAFAGVTWNWTISGSSGLTVSPSGEIDNTGNTMTISGSSGTAGTYTASVSATGYLYETYIPTNYTYLASLSSGSYTLTFNFVTVAIAAWNDVTEDWETGDAAAEIAAGAIASRTHQTDINVTASIQHEVEIPLTMTGGAGHATGTDADLAIGGTHLAPGDTTYLTTDIYGALIGTLTSSDTTNDTTISGGGGSAQVTFAWDNYAEDDKWDLSPPYIIPGDQSYIAVKLAHNYYPLDGHNILFTISSVTYVDGTGEQTVVNTPESPSDLSAWADFDQPAEPTDGTGTSYATIHFKEASESATWIQIRIYDLSVWAP